ncbi:MAG: YraN family protein [Chloroflexota bacterium]|nr:MAG: YraN family protein [Chloroflexota bacterium]
MRDDRQGLGHYAEELVARHLDRKGWQIVQRNYHCRWGEIDLIARDQGCLVFVEVRARRGDAFGTAAESITPRKAARLLASAQFYLAENGLEESPWRIDVAALDLTPRGQIKRLEVLENAVEGGGSWGTWSRTSWQPGHEEE